MSEGLTDQTSIAMDSCHVLMGVEDTCLGPLKKGPKRVPKWSFWGTKPWISGSDVRKTHGVDLDHVKFDIGKHDFTPFRVFLDMWHHHETPESPDFQW